MFSSLAWDSFKSWIATSLDTPSASTPIYKALYDLCCLRGRLSLYFPSSLNEDTVDKFMGHAFVQLFLLLRSFCWGKIILWCCFRESAPLLHRFYSRIKRNTPEWNESGIDLCFILHLFLLEDFDRLGNFLQDLFWRLISPDKSVFLAKKEPAD